MSRARYLGLLLAILVTFPAAALILSYRLFRHAYRQLRHEPTKRHFHLLGWEWH